MLGRLGGATGPWVEPRGRSDHFAFHDNAQSLLWRADEEAFATLEDFKNERPDDWNEYTDEVTKKLGHVLPQLTEPLKNSDILPQDVPRLMPLKRNGLYVPGAPVALASAPKDEDSSESGSAAPPAACHPLPPTDIFLDDNSSCCRNNVI